MSRNRRFPPVKLGDLGTQLGDLKRTLIKAEAAAAEVKRQEEEAEKKRAASELPKPAPKPTGPRPQLKKAYLDRLNTPLPGEVKANPKTTTSPPPAPKPTVIRKPIVRPEPPAQPKPAQISPAKMRELAADKVRALVAASTPSIEERPTAISNSSRNKIDQAVSAGADLLRENPGPDEDGYIIGFDFGTSSLKVAYRQPYVADDPVAVLPVPKELRSANHPGLWQSVVWFHPQKETFSLYPEDGAIALDGFKTGLIAGNGWKAMPQSANVTRGEAATAFLTLHFAYIVGAYSIEQPLHPVGGEHFALINIGIPVAVRDDKRAFAEFSRLVAAAYALAPDACSLRLDRLKQELASAPTKLPEFLQLVPELTAAIAGYAADPMVQLGAHILVDVGASTLDIVAFNLQAQLRAAVFTAGVDLFGAGALQIARAGGVDDDDFTRACDHLFDEVYGRAKADNRAPSLFKPGPRGPLGRGEKPVQLVITGGGCDTDIHTRFINTLPRENVLGAIPFKRPTPPPKILKEPGDQSRLLLAYGLTRDITELHELRLPSEIEDIKPIPVQTFTMIDKDMV
ncbi:hypothetical protein [Porphyrobacter sp. LM 6]|jgi:hypothetical protein|uniref:hypothetical protein n=1 Tax=Porphyrobacter sp. LM 6 TaxID=1896196 RepID=UPI00086390A1|nr:hypothetical protein [Porphyrobacter sp. LM 6]AOL94000.1 hypothetical protein BG023_111062 [Porphyrobacter sp. LM 6]